MPPDDWCGNNSKEYIRAKSNLDIQHDDYSFCVDSHPFLPLYVTGNAKGVVSLWNFDQLEDKSLDQWNAVQNPSQANPKKKTVKKIKFNGYGDKVGTIL